jgi:rubredoxin
MNPPGGRSPGDPDEYALYVRCKVCGKTSGPLGSEPNECPECGASRDNLTLVTDEQC